MDPHPLTVEDGPLELDLLDDDLQEWVSSEEFSKLIDDLGPAPELQEAYAAELHPRDRAGQWMRKLGLGGLHEVGGAPRDRLLGKDPKDVDYMAMETPERIRQAVEEAGGEAMPLVVRDRLVGVRAVHPDLPPGGVEIVPPRVEQSLGEGRHDFTIVPHPGLDGSASTEQMIADDAQRRDYTANAIYRNADSGELVDPTGRGVQDVHDGILRMTHDQSFQEDPLRMLRGARFASQHGLTPDETTLAAMRRDSPGMTALTQRGVSGTVQTELEKLLMGPEPGKALRLMRDTGMLTHLLPELAPMVGFDQRSVYHEHPVDEHTFEVIDTLARAGASHEARLAALFHDSGKPATATLKPDGHFRFHSHAEHGDHQDVGAQIATRTLRRLNYPKDTIDHVSGLVREHMLTAVEKPTEVKARRLRARFSDRFLADLLDHKRADMEGHGEMIAKDHSGVAKLRELLAANADAPRGLKDLRVTGRDVIGQGIPEGPMVGRALKQLLREVVDNPSLNKPEWLVNRARALHERGQLEESDLEEGELDGLEEAFNANQPRFPKGHAKAGQWRPKLVTGAGRIAPGHLERDISKLNDLIQEATRNGPNVAGFDVDRVGKEVESIALRYSARKHYEKRLADIQTERRALQDVKWDAYSAAWLDERDPVKRDAMEPEQFLGAKDAQKIKDLTEEEIRLRKQRDFADRDAMLGVLKRIRPMGGKLNQEPEGVRYAVDRASGIEREYIEAHPDQPWRTAMAADLNANLTQVLKVIPKAWLDDTNAKGTVRWLFSADRAWANTTTDAAAERDQYEHVREPMARLGEQGYEFLGTHHELPTFLMFREPKTGDVIAMREAQGDIVTGIGDFENTPLVLDASGSMNLPQFAERPSAEQVKQFITPMDNLPPPRVVASPTSAMGPDWDPYDKMREGVAQYEREGWKFVGMRGKWATLTKGDESVSLNWGGEPLTRQIGPPEKRGLPPLNPYGQIPLPPRPSAINTQIKIDPRADKKPTLVHEICHRLEVAYGEQNRAGYHPISMATHHFLADRTHGEALQKLKDLYPGYAYEEHELARPDRFVDAYIGKQYHGESTEVLTMGMEMLWYPRYGERDINKDPEMRRLILGMLATL